MKADILLSLSNYQIAALTVCLFLHHLILTVLLGLSFLPRGLIFKKNKYWNLFLAWLAGFNFLASWMVFLGLSAQIRTVPIIVSIIVFWGIVILSRKKIYTNLSFVKFDFHWLKNIPMNIPVVVIPVVVICLIMFFSSLVPHTKADEVSYHMYFVKLVSTNHGFVKAYSPLESLLFMGYQTYNIWGYYLGGEYVPSLNSFVCYVLSLIVLFFWVREHFGEKIAIWALAFSGTVVGKVVFSIAAGDNALNHLLVMCSLMLSYDILTEVSGNEKKMTAREIEPLIFLFSMVSASSVIVKFSAVLFTAPLWLYVIWRLVLNKNKFSKSIWVYFFSAVITAIPFLLKQYILYSNPVFPAGLSLFGSSYFPVDALTQGYDRIRAASAMPSSNFFIASFEILIFFAKTFQPNPYGLLLLLPGFVMLVKKERALAAIFVFAYIASYRLLPHDMLRFYSGACDFLTIFGLVFLFEYWVPLLSESIRKLIKISTICTLYLLATGIMIYTSQFAAFFLKADDPISFLEKRVQCIDTIQWINQNLDAKTKVLTETRDRYYFDVAVEGADPTVLGHSMDIMNNEREFYQILKNNKITHILAVNPGQETPLHKFLQDKNYAERVYFNNEEVVLGRRFRKPILGTTAVFALKASIQ